MNIENALTATAQKLQCVSDSPRLDAELLLMFVLGESRSHLYAHPDRVLKLKESVEFSALVARRVNREPIAYLTGEKEFWSLPLRVTAETLVPRPETELLVEQALALIPNTSKMRILDLGTGCGAIAIAIASERPQCGIVATDISAPALSIAADNAERHQLTNITFLRGDWLAAVSGEVFDIIVANPPYVARVESAISRLPHEPDVALFADEDGLAAIRQIAADTAAHLVEGGTLLLEHGADQESVVAGILSESGWQDVQCRCDLQGLPRVTLATRALLREANSTTQRQ